MEIDVGQIVGNKYVLVRLLGAGAMGQVWAARHQALQQTFAVKLMVPPSSNAYEGVETSLRRFQNEAQIAAALSRKSRHIAAVTDYGIDDGTAYLVMELLEGEGLEKRIGGDDGRRLHPEEVSNVVTQIAKGLTVAHGEGVTHRDLKPANVFFTKTEEGDLLVKLLDFGIAQMARRIVKPKDGQDKAPTRLTIKGMVLGSPAYMSPEQAMAESPDHRADVWSLAVVAFESLAGVAPFFAKDADETILRICNFQSTPLRKVMPDASEELENVFKRAFSSRIEDRFQTAASFAGTLAAALPTPARRLADTPPPPIEVPAPMELESGMSLKVPVRPRKLVPAILVGAGAGLVIAAAVFVPRLLHERAVPAPSATTTATTTVASVPPPPATSVVEIAPPQTASTHATNVPTTTTTVRKTVTPPVTTTVTATSVTAAPSKSVDRSAVF